MGRRTFVFAILATVAVAAMTPRPGIAAGDGDIPAPSATQVRLADPIYPTELKRLMMDRPGKFQLVDIRPAEHFADYSLPGSLNVDVPSCSTIRPGLPAQRRW